jgi:CRISPR-associated endonuclease/helicase Cas3
VLGLIQNNRRPLFSFPALANGAFVFNEVHQYNESMFGALLRFLGAFAGAPVLVMTATLAQDRLAALAEVARQTGGHLKTVSGPGELERLERYELIGPKRQLPWPDIAATLLKGGKVLWVANTVNRAIDFARQASKLSPLLYHSRFRYVDRVAKHFALMSAFSDKSREPILAVTTQVCEVSLDISADLLVTDLAPIPALIQRMGRLNRRAEPGTPVHISQVHLLEPDSARPYSGDEFDFGIVRKWTDSLIGRRLSQQDLTIAFEQLAGEQSGSYPTHSTWLDGGPFSTQSSLRGVDSTVPVILEEDRNKCVRIGGRPDFAAIARFAIPMTLSPVIKELPGWPRVGYAFVVPEGRMDYSEEEGGRWARE